MGLYPVASERHPDNSCTQLHLPLLEAAHFVFELEPSAINQIDGLLAIIVCLQIPHISALEEARRRIKRDSDIAEQTADAALAEDSEPEGSEVSYDSDKGPAPIDSEADSDRGTHIAVQYIP